MKKYLVLLLCCLFLLGSCATRSAPGQESAEVSREESPSVPNVLEQQNDLPSNLEESPTQNTNGEEASAEKEDNHDGDERSDDELGDSQSGTFHLLDSGYEITLKSPFSGIYDEMAAGFYISAQNDTNLQGIVSYTDRADEVKAIEENITVLNDTLKNDDSVKDFKYDRSKNAEGLYSITFSYRNIGDEYSASGYNYVFYRQTAEGMLTVMFTAQDSSYADSINSVFQSVQPATDEAVDPPTR